MDGAIKLTMTFDAGHRIVGHKGKCARLHGHTYKLEVSVIGKIKDPGFVVDFGDIKDFVNQWDHMLLLWDEDRVLEDVFGFMDGPDDPVRMGILSVPFNPTAEHMADWLAVSLQQEFDLDYVHITLWETPNACATAHKVRP